MIGCANDAGFVKHFNENMESLSMPTLGSVYDSIAATLATVTAIGGVVDQFGTRVTLMEAAKLTFKSEKLVIGAGLLASFWVGAAIGSLAVASGRTLGCGVSIGEALWTAHQLGIQGGWIQVVYTQRPDLLNTQR